MDDELFKDWIAVYAMSALLANSDPQLVQMPLTKCAQAAYDMAEAMIAEKKKRTTLSDER